MADPAADFQAFKQSLATRFNIPLPNQGGQEFGGADPMTAQGAPAVDRNQQLAGRGTAPFTAHNMGVLASNVSNLMGGMGPVLTGASSIAEMASGQPAGSLGGIQSFEGYRAIPPERRRMIHNLIDLEREQQRAQSGEAYGGGGRGAVDSHGQVRGGGTGSKGGGTVAGGPR